MITACFTKARSAEATLSVPRAARVRPVTGLARLSRWLTPALLCLGAWVSPSLQAGEPTFLEPSQAFDVSTRWDANAVVVTYRIHEGYYLYRQRVGFISATPDVQLGPITFPTGLTHHDEYFGDQEIYRRDAAFRVPLRFSGTPPASVDLTLQLQGCADAGLCYLPQTWTRRVLLPTPSATPVTPAAKRSPTARLNSREKTEFLQPEHAFQVSVDSADAHHVHVHWVIADGYYLYRARLQVRAETPDALGAPAFPPGLPHQDDYFGTQEIYRHSLDVLVPYQGDGTAPLKLTVVSQGCADAGLCYPPLKQLFTIHMEGGAEPRATTHPAALSEQDRLAGLIRQGSLPLVIAAFFGLGLLLAFTPCVLPMIPILAGLIAGDRARPTPWRGFSLSLAYVMGMSVTYTVAGIVFAAAGRQAQAVFQQPWILVLFAALFVALALAMLGFYELQMPSAVQTRFTALSQRIRGGRLVSTAIMGALSSLIVTACVAPPLVAALAVIGQVGDLTRGGLALAALSFGMGSPLLLVGASAGQLLPKAGAWMSTVKAFFGVAFLGVAAWMLDRLLAPGLMMGVWALVALAALAVTLTIGLPGGRRTPLRWVMAALSLLVALILIVSGISGGTDPLHPWQSSPFGSASSARHPLSFTRIHTVAELDAALAEAVAHGAPTLLDFYADWCVSCKEMQARTFSDPHVQQALASYRRLTVDVTANSLDDQALLQRFGLFGPPTTAFFGANGRERVDARLVGFMNANDFTAHLAQWALVP